MSLLMLLLLKHVTQPVTRVTVGVTTLLYQTRVTHGVTQRVTFLCYQRGGPVTPLMAGLTLSHLPALDMSVGAMARFGPEPPCWSIRPRSESWSDSRARSINLAGPPSTVLRGSL